MKRKAFRYALLVSVFVLILFSVAAFALAHSGGTDSEGGHNSPDGYHYHHGYPAHQHPNGECPYDYDDNVDHQDRSSSSSTSRSSASSDDSIPWYSLAIILFLLFFLSFGVPTFVAVRLGKDEKSVGCLCWIIFLSLLVLLAYLLSHNII